MKLLHKTEEEESVTDIDVFEKYVVLYLRNVVSPGLRIILLPEFNKK